MSELVPQVLSFDGSYRFNGTVPGYLFNFICKGLVWGHHRGTEHRISWLR